MPPRRKGRPRYLYLRDLQYLGWPEGQDGFHVALEFWFQVGIGGWAIQAADAAALARRLARRRGLGWECHLYLWVDSARRMLTAFLRFLRGGSLVVLDLRPAPPAGRSVGRPRPQNAQEARRGDGRCGLPGHPTIGQRQKNLERDDPQEDQAERLVARLVAEDELAQQRPEGASDQGQQVQGRFRDAMPSQDGLTLVVPVNEEGRDRRDDQVSPPSSRARPDQGACQHQHRTCVQAQPLPWRRTVFVACHWLAVGSLSSAGRAVGRSMLFPPLGLLLGVGSGLGRIRLPGFRGLRPLGLSQRLHSRGERLEPTPGDAGCRGRLA